MLVNVHFQKWSKETITDYDETIHDKVTISLMRIFLISFPDPLSILYKKFHYNLWRSLLITFEIAVRWLEGNVKFI